MYQSINCIWFLKLCLLKKGWPVKVSLTGHASKTGIFRDCSQRLIPYNNQICSVLLILLIQPCFIHGKNLTLFLPANRGCHFENPLPNLMVLVIIYS